MGTRRIATVVTATVATLLSAGCRVDDPHAGDRLEARADLALSPPIETAAFGPLPSQVLDVYAPPAGGHGGVIVWLHGGGWVGGSAAADEVSPIARWLVVERGWTLLAVHYRLADRDPFPAALHDAKLAIRWAKAVGPSRGLDPSRVVVVGWSAGGHLATMAATTAGLFEPTDVPAGLQRVDSRPAAAVSLAGPLDPGTFATTGTWNPAANRRAVSRLLGCTDDVSVDGCPVAAATVRPSTWADASDPAIYVAAGDLDPISEVTSQAVGPSGPLAAGVGENRVWLDLVDTGPGEGRAHSLDGGLNRWALEQFLAIGPTL